MHHAQLFVMKLWEKNKHFSFFARVSSFTFEIISEVSIKSGDKNQ